jgi:hypothetical protein
MRLAPEGFTTAGYRLAADKNEGLKRHAMAAYMD